MQITPSSLALALHRPTLPWAWMRMLGSGRSRHGATTEIETRELTKGQMQLLARPLDCSLECLHGTVWITQDGDVRDVILERGQTYRPDRGGCLIMQALASASVRVARERN